MGLFDWLFKRASGSAQEAAQQSALDGDEHFFTLPSRQFVGQCSWSPTKRYRLAWGRRINSSAKRAVDSDRSGRYLLLEGNQILVEGKMLRPDRGEVAENGTFILTDGKLTSELSGGFVAFDVQGRVIVRRDFKANIFNAALSSDGHLAVCQTCNSYDHPENSSIIAVFDLTEGKEIANWRPESGWAHFYKFPANAETIGLGYRDLGVFYYSLVGGFIDRNLWQDACLVKGKYGTVILMADWLIKDAESKITPELSSKLISCIDRVAPELTKADGKWQALALKLRGICLESRGAGQAALSCYDKALALDRKIGIKRRADQLRKALTQSAR